MSLRQRKQLLAIGDCRSPGPFFSSPLFFAQVTQETADHSQIQPKCACLVICSSRPPGRTGTVSNTAVVEAWQLLTQAAQQRETEREELKMIDGEGDKSKMEEWTGRNKGRGCALYK